MIRTLLLSLIIFFSSFKHPFYLSVTDLKYNAKEKALQGSVKIFTNDLEAALKKTHGRTIDLINVKDTVATQKILDEYLKKRLTLSVNKKLLEYNIIGFEREEEAVWIYIEIKNCPKPKNVSIENSILYDFIKDQMNIVHIEVDGDKKSLKVNNPENQLIFDFGT